MAGLAHRALASLVILALTAGCDNVEWGGASFVLQPPPPATVGADPDVPDDSLATESEVPPPPLPTGPVLYAGTRSGTTVSLLPLFEFRGDSILPLSVEADEPGFDAYFASRRMAPGTEFTLFADGVRVGSLVADTVASVEGWCVPRTAAVGVPELIPAAAGATRFLALARGSEPGTSHAEGAFPGEDQTHRQASRILAQTAIMQRNALWPDDLDDARADLAVTRSGPGSDAAVAATFMFRDRLAVEDPRTPVAYSLFVMGTPRETRYGLDYVWYRRVGDDGKGAPRFFQQFDWDGDGRSEVLLEVLGTNSRWPVVLEATDGEWSATYEAGCDREAGLSGG